MLLLNGNVGGQVFHSTFKEGTLTEKKKRGQEEKPEEENQTENKTENSESASYYTYMSKEEMIEKLDKVGHLLGTPEDSEEGTRFSDDTIGFKVFSDEGEALDYARKLEMARIDRYKETQQRMQERKHRDKTLPDIDEGDK